METELWPEILYQSAQKFPLIQINARLSKKSTDAPVFIRYLLRRALANFTMHLTRESSDVDNLLDLGADKNKIKVIGNLKNQTSNQSVNTKTSPVGRPYILLASSHEAEECNFIESRSLQSEPYLIVIAPRHPDRRNEIITCLKKHSLFVCCT